jgi:hypothetical protein
VDPSYADDINSELQDQGIGVAADQFNTRVDILGHNLRNGKLTLKARLGNSMQPVDVSWEDLRQDVPATLASYILKHGIGPGSAVRRVRGQGVRGFLRKPQ